MTQLTATQVDQLNAILQSFQTPPYVPPEAPAQTPFFRDAYSLADDFNADPTGVNPADAALAKAYSAGIKRLYVGGTFRLNGSLPLMLPFMYGDGMLQSGFNIYNSMGDGVVTPSGGSSILRVQDMTFQYKGTSAQPAGKHGLRATRKIYADSIQVKGFTNDGIYTDTADGTIGGAAFFSRWDNVWSKNNGRDGFNQRMGANCHQHRNCQYDKNKRYGFNHNTDGGATYNTTIDTSQACYNGQIGWQFQSGTSIRGINLYAEYNGTPTNTNTDGYTNTQLDFSLAAACNHSTIEIGSLFDNKLIHALAPLKGQNDAVVMLWGGMRIFGSVAYKLPY